MVMLVIVLLEEANFKTNIISESKKCRDDQILFLLVDLLSPE